MNIDRNVTIDVIRKKDLHDNAFAVATNMGKDKFEFQYQGEEHMIWDWRGDYLNLGAGAELGIYSQTFIPGHYRTRPDLGIPMKLGLMDKNGNMIIQRGASDNWWVTGFNPRYLGANPAELTAIYTLDFSQNPAMFEAFYQQWVGTPNWRFDRATCTAVFIFGGGSIDG
jgi:hypothetical protein